MRSLVSDLIPEYNKKLQFFLKRHWLMLWTPLFLLAHHQPMCIPLTYRAAWEAKCTLPYGNFEHSLYHCVAVAILNKIYEPPPPLFYPLVHTVC